MKQRERLLERLNPVLPMLFCLIGGIAIGWVGYMASSYILLLSELLGG